MRPRGAPLATWHELATVYTMADVEQMHLVIDLEDELAEKAAEAPRPQT